MFKPNSSSDHRPKVGLPSHSVPQPLLEASVVTTFLLCPVSRITPRFSQKGSLQRARADTQAMDGTLCFSQNWLDRMWCRPNLSSGEAAAIRPSILWKALSRQAVPSLKETAWRWTVMARSVERVAVICTELITVPRNKTRWLSHSMLLAKLTLSPRQSKWLRRGSCAMLKPPATGPEWAEVVENADSHLSQRGESRIHAYKCGEPGIAQTAGPSIDMLPLRMRFSRIVCDGGLPECESTCLSDPATWISPLGIFTGGSVSKWSSWTTVSSGRNLGVWDL